LPPELPARANFSGHGYLHLIAAVDDRLGAQSKPGDRDLHRHAHDAPSKQSSCRWARGTRAPPGRALRRGWKSPSTPPLNVLRSGWRRSATSSTATNPAKRGTVRVSPSGFAGDTRRIRAFSSHRHLHLHRQRSAVNSRCRRQRPGSR
jgi:hypothetical protein